MIEATGAGRGRATRRGTAAAIAAIVLVGTIAYANSFGVPFQFDDPIVITREPAITGFHLAPASRRFLGDLSFALSYRCFGEATAGYHAVNLLIHLANALLLLGLVGALWRTEPLRRSRFASRGAAAALVAALLFVAHPLQTQAVTYIVQRYASLAALFFLLSVTAYVRFRLAERRRSALGWYALFLGACGAACWTKENAVVLPLVAVAVELTFFAGPWRRRALPFTPFLAGLLLAVGVALARGTSLAAIDAMTRVDTDLARWDYFLTQTRVVAGYLRLLVLPIGQNLDPDVAVSTSIAEPAVLLSIGLHTGVLCAGALAMEAGFRRDGVWRVVGFGLLWFYLALLVESSFIPIVDVMYEHRAYLPSAGPFMVAGALLGAVLAARAPRGWRLGATVLVGLLAALTFARNRVWRDELSLWTDVVEKSPNKSRGINNLGIAWMERGEPARAASLFERAIRADPGYAKAYFNLGEAKQEMGDCVGAIPLYEAFLTRFPSYPDTYRRLAECYERLGRSAEARAFRETHARILAELNGRALEVRLR